MVSLSLLQKMGLAWARTMLVLALEGPWALAWGQKSEAFRSVLRKGFDSDSSPRSLRRLELLRVRLEIPGEW